MDPHATGDGAVMLDIGGDIGALIVTLPDELLGRELEIVPAGGEVAAGASVGAYHAGEHHPADAPPHVGIVPRLMGRTTVATAVFMDLSGGRYRLSLAAPHHHDDDHTHEQAHEHPHEHSHEGGHGQDHPHEHGHTHDALPERSAHDDVSLEVDVVGGEVVQVAWPTD